MIAIIDYGMGNLRSVQKAFEKSGADAVITHDQQLMEQADKLVLPGVGAMAPAMERLKELDLVETICSCVNNGKPFLGICLGFQLLFEKSFEGGTILGLGLLSGSVERFKVGKVPHMGWNSLQLANKECPLWSGISQGVFVYFCHSFFAKPSQLAIASSSTDYGITFTSSVWKDNIFGVQFHPEKSQDIGLKILNNFIAFS